MFSFSTGVAIRRVKSVLMNLVEVLSVFFVALHKLDVGEERFLRAEVEFCRFDLSVNNYGLSKSLKSRDHRLEGLLVFDTDGLELVDVEREPLPMVLLDTVGVDLVSKGGVSGLVILKDGLGMVSQFSFSVGSEEINGVVMSLLAPQP